MELKITVSKSELLNKLKVAGKVIKATNVSYAHGCFLFEVKSDKLYVTGADEEGNITTLVDCDLSSGENVKFLIEHILFDGIKELVEQPIEISVEITKAKNVIATLKHQSGLYNLPALVADDFQLMENHDPERPINIKLSREILVDGIKTTYPFASNDELRPIMNSVFVESTRGQLNVVATNTNVLALVEYTGLELEEFGFILPVKISKIIADLASTAEEVQLEIASKTVTVKFDNTEIIYRLLEGKYPNYRSVIPTNNDKFITAGIDEVLSALKRALIFANDKSSMLKFSVKNELLEIVGSDVDFNQSAREEVHVEYSSDIPIEIGFKGELIKRCVDSVDTEQLSISLSEPTRAALVSPYYGDEAPDKIITTLIMPMMINN